MKRVAYNKLAIKALKRMPANTSSLIQAKIEQYAVDPSSLSANVVKLQGRDGYRLRVGDWRVIFDEDDVVMTVLNVAPRGGAYE